MPSDEVHRRGRCAAGWSGSCATLIANASIDHAEHKPVAEFRMAADADNRRRHGARTTAFGLRPGEEKAGVQPVLAFGPPRGWRRSGGTGLGLAISIEDAPGLHQGRLEAWGEPGKGRLLPAHAARWCGGAPR